MVEGEGEEPAGIEPDSGGQVSVAVWLPVSINIVIWF